MLNASYSIQSSSGALRWSRPGAGNWSVVLSNWILLNGRGRPGDGSPIEYNWIEYNQDNIWKFNILNKHPKSFWKKNYEISQLLPMCCVFFILGWCKEEKKPLFILLYIYYVISKFSWGRCIILCHFVYYFFFRLMKTCLFVWELFGISLFGCWELGRGLA